MSSGWSYFTSELVAGTVLADLPLTDVTLTRRLGGAAAGDLQGKLALTERAADLLAATDPWRCALWVQLDGALRWGGPIIGRPYTSGQGSIDVRAADASAYFAGRIIRRNHTASTKDQLLIQRELYANAQAESGGNIGAELGSATSGVLRDRTYLGAQLKPVEEAAQQLSDVFNGFDYAWSATWVGRLPRPLLRQGYPTLGAGADVVLEYGGDVTSYAFPEEGANMATAVFAVGKKDDTTNLVPQADTTATDLITAGYPLLEKVYTYSDVATESVLQAHADADVAAAAGPVAVVQVTMGLADMLASGVDLGAVVRLRITDERFPTGHDERYRVVAITERPDAGTATVDMAPRVLVGGKMPSRASAANLLANVARRLLRVEAT